MKERGIAALILAGVFAVYLLAPQKPKVEVAAPVAAPVVTPPEQLAKVGDRVFFADRTTNCWSKNAYSGLPGSREFYCNGYVNAKSSGKVKEIDTPFADRPDLSHYCVEIDGWSETGHSPCFWFYRSSFTIVKQEKI